MDERLALYVNSELESIQIEIIQIDITLFSFSQG